MSGRKKKEIDLRDRFHTSAIINNGGRHAEIGVYNTISHLSERRAAFNLQRERGLHSLPSVSTIPKMNYLQKFPMCIKPGLFVARPRCIAAATAAPRRGKRAPRDRNSYNYDPSSYIKELHIHAPPDFRPRLITYRCTSRECFVYKCDTSYII